jgi:hypothetical protein
LISFYGDYNYYEDIANIYQRLWNEKKYEIYMKILFWKNLLVIFIY